MKRWLLVLIVGALLLSACARDEDGAQQTSSASPQATEAPPCSLDGGSEETVEDDRAVDAPGLLTEVRFDDEGCPRVAFVFENNVPPYEIAYQDPPFAECGSGEEVDSTTWGSSAYIVFHSNSASGVDLSGPEFRQTYEGDRDIDVSSPVLRRLRRTCDFEATLEWVIALDERHVFKVSTLDDPPRLVVDVSET